MKTMRVVEALDVSKDAGHRIMASQIAMMVNVFGLELSKETLHGCVVVTVAGAAHADLNGVLFEQLLVRRAGVVAATVGVME